MHSKSATYHLRAAFTPVVAPKVVCAGKAAFSSEKVKSLAPQHPYALQAAIIMRLYMIPVHLVALHRGTAV